MMETNIIHCGDALAVLQTLPDCCVQSCVTSPPYYGLRDYGAAGQIGLEQSPAEYISRLVTVFREVRRVLRDDGTLWIVVGDSYAGSGKGADGNDVKRRYQYKTGNPALELPKTWEGIKPKDLIGTPWMLAFALRADGWYLRSSIIWHKPNSMPHSVSDRPNNSYEYIFLLAKSRRYYFDYKSLEVPTKESTKQRYKRNFGDNKYAKGVPGQSPQTIYKSGPKADMPSMRRGRDVWSIPTTGHRGSNHYAAFPIELVKPCILAGCPEEGVVLDPFIGSGTTGAAALSLGRQYIGIELNPEYIPLAEKWIKQYEKTETPSDTDSTVSGG